MNTLDTNREMRVGLHKETQMLCLCMEMSDSKKEVTLERVLYLSGFEVGVHEWNYAMETGFGIINIPRKELYIFVPTLERFDKAIELTILTVGESMQKFKRSDIEDLYNEQ